MALRVLAAKDLHEWRYKKHISDEMETNHQYPLETLRLNHPLLPSSLTVTRLSQLSLTLQSMGINVNPD